MRARRLTLSTFIAAVTLGVVTLATPAVADEPAPAADHPEAYVSIEEGPSLTEPRAAYIQLRYTCYGDPTTVDVTVSAGKAEASGSAAIPCQGETDLPVGLRLAVPDGSEGFPPGSYFVDVHASIPGQATLDTQVKVEGPAAQTDVFITTDASPEEVVKSQRITIVGVVRRGPAGEPASLKLALDFRPDGGHWHKVKSVTSGTDGIVRTTVKARKSGNFRLRFTGSADLHPYTSEPDHVVVRPKPKAYRSCAALTKVYKHGVGRDGAVEVGLGVSTWTRSTATYTKNKEFDRDKDGVACEKA